MRLLIFTQYYPPEPHPIPHEIARELISRGHIVTVVTGFPNHPLGRIFDGYRQCLYKFEVVEGVHIVRVPLFPDHSLSKFRRICSYLSFALSAFILAPFLVPKVDIIFVYHTPSVAIPAWWFGLLKRIPFVFNVQDIYPESFLTLGMTNRSWMYRAIDNFIKIVYQKSAGISVISQGFKDNIISKGISNRKIHLIRTWADEKNYYPMPRDCDTAAQWGLDGFFNIVFAGNMGAPQGLHNVIDAAILLKDLPQVRFILIGDGTTKDDLMQRVNENGVENVVFIPRQPASLMAKFYSLADVLLVHLVDSPIFKITIPYKTQSYLACAKPLLMVVDGEAAKLVTGIGAGVAVKPSDPAQLASAVRDLMGMTNSQRIEMGEKGFNFFRENLSLRVGVAKYEELFMNLIASYNKRRL